MALRRWRRAIAVCLLANTISFFTPANATCIVALMDTKKHRIVIATDCRVNRESGPISACKIIQEPNCVAAMAGLFEDGAAEFHLKAMVRAACRERGDLRTKADSFLKDAKAPFEKAAKHILLTDHTGFDETLANRATEVVFAGIQDNHLVLFVRGFVVNSAGAVTPESYESTNDKRLHVGYFLGLNRHIREYVNLHKGWEAMGYAKAARKFVEIEIEAHPDLAGKPITELEIDSKARALWMSAGACASETGLSGKR
jgi:hypothetical protein